jgi:peptidyl-prolyl cis-trans isomerase C
MKRYLRGAIALSSFILALGACDDRLPTVADGPMEPRIVRADDILVAEVEGSPIYLSDVLREAVAQSLIDGDETLSPSSATFAQVLEELIDHRLLALEAVRRKLNEREEAVRRVASARERILANVLVEEIVAAALTDEAVRRMYDEQVSLVELGDEIRARHIVVPDKASAEMVLDLLRKGGDFAAIALSRSIDTITADIGGDLGYFTPDMVTGALAREVFGANVGELVGPVESELGWHVLKVEDRRPEQIPAFEEMRPRLVQFMTFDEIQRQIDMLRARSEVRRYGAPDAATIIQNEPLRLRGARDIAVDEPTPENSGETLNSAPQ